VHTSIKRDTPLVEEIMDKLSSIWKISNVDAKLENNTYGP
jgi:hypothetical protein